MPRKISDADAVRSLVMVRNVDAAITVMIQFGNPSDNNDGFDVLAGDTFSIDRNVPEFKMDEEIYMWCLVTGAINNNVKIIVG